MLKIPKTLTLNEIESLYTDLSGTDQQLTIPTELHCAQMGSIGALIQFLITWAKTHPGGSLATHTTKQEQIRSYLGNLAHSHHGLAAMLLSSDILVGKTQQSVFAEAFQTCDDALKQMAIDEYDELSGPQILLLCADHTDRAYIPQFYAQVSRINDQVRGQKEFTDLADRLILDLSTRHKRSYPPDDNLRENLGTILYELFKNTHLWARHELNREEIAHSIRGIRLELNQLAQVDVKRQPSRTRAFIADAERRKGLVDFIEISLFDSGPGLAARGLNQEIDDHVSLEDEYRGILKCLKKYSSSSNEDHRGIGLIEVMRTLTEAGALLRIRTGHLALLRNFINDPLRDDDDLWLFDWFTESDMLNRARFAEGLLLSMIIPIKVGTQK